MNRKEHTPLHPLTHIHKPGPHAKTRAPCYQAPCKRDPGPQRNGRSHNCRVTAASLPGNGRGGHHPTRNLSGCCWEWKVATLDGVEAGEHSLGGTQGTLQCWGPNLGLQYLSELTGMCRQTCALIGVGGGWGGGRHKHLWGACTRANTRVQQGGGSGGGGSG